MKRIIHFITSLEMGGAQAVLYDLVTHLDAQQFEHEIIFIHDGPYRKLFAQAAIPLHQLTGLISPYDPIALYRLIKLIKKLNPNCLHTILWSANWWGRAAAWFLGIRCINTLHNNSDQNGMVRNLLDFVPPAPTQIIAVSEEVKRSYMQYGWGSKNCPITIIPNGVNQASVWEKCHKNPVLRADLGYTSDQIIIGSVGRFHPIKRYPFLLESFALLHAENPACRLLLIGAGSQEALLREKARMLGIDQFVTFATNRPAYPYYPLMDLFVLCSEKEGVSIALLEAMSVGIPPLITYHHLQHPVIIHGENGYVANTSKATHFAHTMHQLSANALLRSSLGKRARASIITNFSDTAMVASYDKIFYTKTTNKSSSSLLNK